MGIENKQKCQTWINSIKDLIARDKFSNAKLPPKPTANEDDENFSHSKSGSNIVDISLLYDDIKGIFGSSVPSHKGDKNKKRSSGEKSNKKRSSDPKVEKNNKDKDKNIDIITENNLAEFYGESSSSHKDKGEKNNKKGASSKVEKGHNRDSIAESQLTELTKEFNLKGEKSNNKKGSYAAKVEKRISGTESQLQEFYGPSRSEKHQSNNIYGESYLPPQGPFDYHTNAIKKNAGRHVRISKHPVPVRNESNRVRYSMMGNGTSPSLSAASAPSGRTPRLNSANPPTVPMVAASPLLKGQMKTYGSNTPAKKWTSPILPPSVPSILSTPISPPQQYANPLSPRQQYANPLSPRQQYANPLSPRQQYANPLSPPKSYANPLSPPQQYANPLSPPQQYANPMSPPKQFANPMSPPKSYGVPGYKHHNQYGKNELMSVSPLQTPKLTPRLKSPALRYNNMIDEENMDNFDFDRAKREQQRMMIKQDQLIKQQQQQILLLQQKLIKNQKEMEQEMEQGIMEMPPTANF